MWSFRNRRLRFALFRLRGLAFGLGLLACWLLGRVRGVWGIFLLGKTTRCAQTSFSLPEKYPTPPYRRAAQEYRGQKQRKYPEVRVIVAPNRAFPFLGAKTASAFIKRKPAIARRRGVAVGFFAGKRCLSEASCFSKKNPTATPQARPHNRKSGSPNQRPPAKQTGQEPKPDLVETCLNGSNFSTGRVIPTGPAPLP